MNLDVLHRVLAFMPTRALLALAKSCKTAEFRRMALRSIQYIGYEIEDLGPMLEWMTREERHIVRRSVRRVYGVTTLMHTGWENQPFERVTHAKTNMHSFIPERLLPRVEFVTCTHPKELPGSIPATVTTLECDASIAPSPNRYPSVETLYCHNFADLDAATTMFPSLENACVRWITPIKYVGKMVKNLIVLEYFRGDEVRASNAVVLLSTSWLPEGFRKDIYGAKYVWDQTPRHITALPDKCTHLACSDIPLCGLKNVRHLILLRPAQLESPESAVSSTLEIIDIHPDATDLEEQLELMKTHGAIPADTLIRRGHRATPLPRVPLGGFSWRFPDIEDNWT